MKKQIKKKISKKDFDMIEKNIMKKDKKKDEDMCKVHHKPVMKKKK